MGAHRNTNVRHAVALVLGAAALASAVPALDARAESPPPGFAAGPPPPVEIFHVESDSDYASVDTQGTVFVARTTAGTDSSDPGWLLRVDVRLRNRGTSDATVTSLGVSTDGSTYETVVFPTQPVLAPGGTTTLDAPSLSGKGTPPATLTVRVEVDGYAHPAQASYPLVGFDSATPTNGYRFPGRGDLHEGIFWKTKGVHSNLRSQRYGYDLGAARWDGAAGEWTAWSEQADVDEAAGIKRGSKLDHYLVYGLPVFAMADGVIEKCRRSYPDLHPDADHADPSGSFGIEHVDNAPSNVLAIDHGNGEHAAYAHLQQNSIPAALCPVETPGDGVAAGHVPVHVKQGDFLGFAGNSGTRTPHLHIQLHDGDPTASSAVLRSLPLNFHDVFVHTWSYGDPSDSANHFDPTTDTPDWNWVTPAESAMIGIPQLIHPNTCGYDDEPKSDGYTTGPKSSQPYDEPDCPDVPDMIVEPTGGVAIPTASGRITG